MNYITITEAFDWGPAITKVILQVGKPLDISTITFESFRVISIRRYEDGTYNGLTKDYILKELRGEREIRAIYLCDEMGQYIAEGIYLALELAVGPDLVQGSPYNYNINNGFNELVETAYEIEIKEGNFLEDIEGEVVLSSGNIALTFEKNINVIADDFENNQVYEASKYKGIQLRYASYTPPKLKAEKESIPLVIWLHGAGEGGKNTYIALMGNKVVSLATERIQSLFGDRGAIILVPQASTMWMDFDGSATYNNSVLDSQGKSFYTEALKGLIDDYVATHEAVDLNRIYIGGCSNGGYMTVEMITTYPDYFAAAFPICEAYEVGWLTEEKLKNIKNLPIWFTHAKTDTIVPIVKVSVTKGDNAYELDSYTNGLYNRLIALGNNQVYYSLLEKVIDTSGLYFQRDGITPYEYNGHLSWIPVFNNDCVQSIDGEAVSLFWWLGMQRKS